MLTLAAAQRALAAATTEGLRHRALPLAMVVLDAGGHPVVCVRQDGASLFRFEIARAKASGALGMGMDSRILAERAAQNPNFFLSITGFTGGIALSAGGVLLRDRLQAVIGAVGISGDTADIDEACAQAGAAAILEDLA